MNSSEDGASSDEPLADPRVEGAIESLNLAIDALNTLEDTKQATEAAAKRAADVIQGELKELNSSHAKLASRVAPFLAARQQAADAIEYARASELIWKQASADLESAKAERQAASKAAALKKSGGLVLSPISPIDAVARRAKEMLSEKISGSRSAESRVAELRKEAKRASTQAESKARHLGMLADGLEKGGYDIQSAVRRYAEYCERRRGLEEVLEHSAARVRDMEEAKEAASRGVTDMMGNLEALSNELHEADGSSGGGEEGEGAELEEDAPPPAGAAGSPSGWLREASWRPSKDFSDDGFEAKGEWSEDDLSGSDDEEDAPAAGGADGQGAVHAKPGPVPIG